MNIATPEGMRQAIAWQRNMVSLIKDGGAWAVPRSLTLIKILHSKKTAFKAMGWTCLDKEPGPEDQQAFSA